eukprot:743522-Prorocentrum_minimum.AAC.6
MSRLVGQVRTAHATAVYGPSHPPAEGATTPPAHRRWPTCARRPSPAHAPPRLPPLPQKQNTLP